ncbi:MAG: hypothetical protein GWN01_05010 [Nitrosopumilaceae archaeon]|nr:hypothetical protein [Nitrosopumilaceae archaeon]NIU00303.1 hypothetical protein [Nitrosopumilaceae archaeon]NIX60905.1 hypothetical protein [Nitrosopumilaceae archaeon]
MITKHEINVSDICHIEGGEEDSPRYNPSLGLKEFNDYKNLVLMCKTHHKIINDNETLYTVEKLREIKQNHESEMESKNYQIPDRLVQKIMNELDSSQTNIHSGMGNQTIIKNGNITQYYGITSIEDAEKLFDVLN